jgi:hypothetical protein
MVATAPIVANEETANSLRLSMTKVFPDVDARFAHGNQKQVALLLAIHPLATRIRRKARLPTNRLWPQSSDHGPG